MAKLAKTSCGITVIVQHPRGLKRPFVESALDWLEDNDLGGTFTAGVGPTFGAYQFTFSDARTALAFKLRWC